MYSGYQATGLGMTIVRTICGSVVFGVERLWGASGFLASGRFLSRGIVGFQDVGRLQKITLPMRFCRFLPSHWKKGRQASRYQKISFGYLETGDTGIAAMFGVPDSGQDVMRIGCGFPTIMWPSALVVGLSLDTGTMAGISEAPYMRPVISPVIVLACDTGRA